MQRTLLIIGALVFLVGLAWPWLSTLPLGRLPGYIVVKRENCSVYLPLATALIISVIRTVQSCRAIV